MSTFLVHRVAQLGTVRVALDPSKLKSIFGSSKDPTPVSACATRIVTLLINEPGGMLVSKLLRSTEAADCAGVTPAAASFVPSMSPTASDSPDAGGRAVN